MTGSGRARYMSAARRDAGDQCWGLAQLLVGTGRGARL